MKILFVQGKGGVGKSTLAFLFAVTLAKAGKTVSVLDLDPQESLTAWLKDTDGFEFSTKGEITVVDTPPRIDDPKVLKAIAQADRIIVPATPSPAEIATLRHSADIIAKQMGAGARAFIVFNRVKKSSTYGKNLASIAQKLPLAVAKNAITDREVYKHVLLDGWSALDAAAKDEVMSLALEVQ
jgi:chromosome partitioning protein